MNGRVHSISAGIFRDIITNKHFQHPDNMPDNSNIYIYQLHGNAISLVCNSLENLQKIKDKYSDDDTVKLLDDTFLDITDDSEAPYYIQLPLEYFRRELDQDTMVRFDTQYGILPDLTKEEMTYKGITMLPIAAGLNMRHGFCKIVGFDRFACQDNKARNLALNALKIQEPIFSTANNVLNELMILANGMINISKLKQYIPHYAINTNSKTTCKLYGQTAHHTLVAPRRELEILIRAFNIMKADSSNIATAYSEYVQCKKKYFDLQGTQVPIAVLNMVSTRICAYKKERNQPKKQINNLLMLERGWNTSCHLNTGNQCRSTKYTDKLKTYGITAKIGSRVM